MNQLTSVVKRLKAICKIKNAARDLYVLYTKRWMLTVHRLC